MRHKHSVNSFVFSPFTTKGPKFYSSFKCFESIQSKMYKKTVQKIEVLQKLISLVKVKEIEFFGKWWKNPEFSSRIRLYLPRRTFRK